MASQLGPFGLVLDCTFLSSFIFISENDGVHLDVDGEVEGPHCIAADVAEGLWPHEGLLLIVVQQGDEEGSWFVRGGRVVSHAESGHADSKSTDTRLLYLPLSCSSLSCAAPPGYSIFRC